METKYTKTWETKTLTLTDEEAYMLACIMGYVRYSPKVRALLEKVDSLMDRELDCDDFDRVAFLVDIEKGQASNVEIAFN